MKCTLVANLVCVVFFSWFSVSLMIMKWAFTLKIAQKLKLHPRDVSAFMLFELLMFSDPKEFGLMGHTVCNVKNWFFKIYLFS